MADCTNQYHSLINAQYDLLMSLSLVKVVHCFSVEFGETRL